MRKQCLIKLALFSSFFLAGQAFAFPNSGGKGPFLEGLDLTDKQREEVQEITRDHRRNCQKELLTKLSGVLSAKQLDVLEDKMEGFRQKKRSFRKNMRDRVNDRD